MQQLQHLLRTPYCHVWTSTDLIGVETCVALKNIYALAVGLVGGLLERDGVDSNGTRSCTTCTSIFAQGLWETATWCGTWAAICAASTRCRARGIST
ncbi:MAG: hypothetical protein R2851_06475 [Caldilineaceae bacterium]